MRGISASARETAVAAASAVFTPGTPRQRTSGGHEGMRGSAWVHPDVRVGGKRVDGGSRSGTTTRVANGVASDVEYSDCESARQFPGADSTEDSDW